SGSREQFRLVTAETPRTQSEGGNDDKIVGVEMRGFACLCGFREHFWRWMDDTAMGAEGRNVGTSPTEQGYCRRNFMRNFMQCAELRGFDVKFGGTAGMDAEFCAAFIQWVLTAGAADCC